MSNSASVLLKRLNPIIEKVKKLLENESTGHDFYHAKRVLENALYIQKKEGGDAFIIGTSALVHDLCRPWEKKTGKSHFGSEALDIIDKILKQSEVTLDKRKILREIIADHDISDWTSKGYPKSIELKVLQDSDKLDAIGAIGIARVFSYVGAHGLPIYLPENKLEFTNNFMQTPNHGTAAIAHFYENLLKIKDNMNTETGKSLAHERHKFMESFLKQFFKEWELGF